ncbi:unnamed protein product [Brassica rapa subsp. trilocularis]
MRLNVFFLSNKFKCDEDIFIQLSENLFLGKPWVLM